MYPSKNGRQEMANKDLAYSGDSFSGTIGLVTSVLWPGLPMSMSLWVSGLVTPRLSPACALNLLTLISWCSFSSPAVLTWDFPYQGTSWFCLTEELRCSRDGSKLKPENEIRTNNRSRKCFTRKKRKKSVWKTEPNQSLSLLSCLMLFWVFRIYAWMVLILPD
jgi:hypothetical protein